MKVISEMEMTAFTYAHETMQPYRCKVYICYKKIPPPVRRFLKLPHNFLSAIILLAHVNGADDLVWI